jgi:hypothetical protein
MTIRVSTHRTIAAIVLGFVTSCAPAHAEPNCAGLADALAGLATNYGESPRVTALMGENMLIITASPQGGWTALEVHPDGLACIVAAGDGFGVADPAPGGEVM